MRIKVILICYCFVQWWSIPHAQEQDTPISRLKGIKGVVTSVYNGTESVWIGTEKDGLYRYNKTSAKLGIIKNNGELLSKKIQCISDDDLHIWIGTDKGLYRYDRLNSECKKIPVKKSESILSFLHHNNKLFIGTSKGFLIYDTKKGEWRDSRKVLDSIRESFTSIAVDRHFFWFGMENGVIRYNNRTAEITRYEKKQGLPDNIVTCAFKDNRNIWFGTRNGLGQYNILLDTWTTHTTLDGLIDNMITAI